ncbi:hypothetical protein WJX73_008630 [Symbiochloris irregularis]|uniref:5-formyltetrahydrofolate cyclo-ligase n=1 Tax=Symbiochloris irregularis TaxID=706552 RepID=A0AAW1NQV0_9CHLO
MAAAASSQAELKDEKKALRKQMRQVLQGLDLHNMQQQSKAVCERILASKLCSTSKVWGAYMTCEKLKEVDCMPIVDHCLQERGLQLLVPVVEDKHSNMTFYHIDNKEGLEETPPFGILQPKHTYSDGTPRRNAQELDDPMDVLLLPGMAFDAKGNRLGRGGGYYDKCLSSYMQQGSPAKPSPLIVALAFREMIVDSVPVDESDRAVDAIVTADQVYACSARAKAAF